MDPVYFYMAELASKLLSLSVWSGNLWFHWYSSLNYRWWCLLINGLSTQGYTIGLMYLSLFQLLKIQWSPSLVTTLLQSNIQKLCGKISCRKVGLSCSPHGWMYLSPAELSVLVSEISGICVLQCILTQRQTLSMQATFHLFPKQFRFPPTYGLKASSLLILSRYTGKAQIWSSQLCVLYVLMTLRQAHVQVKV